MKNRLQPTLLRTQRIFEKGEEYLMLFTLFLLFLLPLLDILDRETSLFQFSSSSLYLKHILVWFTLLAGQLASKKREHLSLAAFEHLLPDHLKKWTQLFVAYVVATIIFTISFSSLGYIKLISAGHAPIGILPMAFVLTIIPIGFFIMGVRAALAPTFSTRKKFLILISALLSPILLELLPDSLASLMYVPTIIILIIATLLGAPIFTVLSGFAAILIFHTELSIFGTDQLFSFAGWLTGISATEPALTAGLSSIPHMAYQVLTEDAFPTIPLFTMVGFILSESKAGERLVAFFKALLGSVPGGIAIMAVLVSAFFTTFTGASGVTILALGGLLYYVMTKDGYSDQFTTGYLTSSGSIGLLFPPSLPIILYAAKAEIDPKLLFAGGLFPGILLIVSLALYAMFKKKKSLIPPTPFNMTKLLTTFRAALGEIFLPVIILVVYFGGFATIVQSASIAVLYLLITHLFIHKDITLKDLPTIALKAAPIAGSVLIIIAAANSLQDYIVMAEIPMKLTEWFTAHFDPANPANKWVFLIILNIALLITGFFMDIFSAIIVVIPLITPISSAFGIHPVHLGVIFLANLELGYLTPPVGLNLFLSALRFKKPLLSVYKSVIPFLLILGSVVILITYVPAITMTGISLYEKIFPQKQQKIANFEDLKEESLTVDTLPVLPANFMDAINSDEPTLIDSTATPPPAIPDDFMSQINSD